MSEKIRFHFKAICIGCDYPDTDTKKGDERAFSLSFSQEEYQQDGFNLMTEARHFVINHYDMSVQWIVERDYYTEKLQREGV